ncbi:MAG TPA: type II toxin-antitoxin system VapC family toxin [Xanthomonadaceae bacterium]|nr:type II toxin-antitoxin system VapC family toxin [Xanthomonadaceae bacterium]
MRVLLDTHALYWYIEGDSQLSTTARTLIQDAANEVLISPASYWEIAIEISLGKWQLNRPYADFIAIGLQEYGFLILPILPAHTARLIGMPFHHKDPFDRLLAAQALAEEIPLVSADTAFDDYGVTRWW